MEVERQHDWDSFLTPSFPMALLARGPAMASALEGALLFNEITKFPAFAAPIASFRHGPIEVVNANFRVIVFASGDRTRELNLALGEELARFGAVVRVVGPHGDMSTPPNSHGTPSVREGLAPLLDIVPLQVAATRLVELKGIWPGSFRHTPQVAVDEARFIAPPGGSHPPYKQALDGLAIEHDARPAVLPSERPKE
jgi:glucosamine--fructose-6-phosphate aminotransferase (isomerizing)